MVSSNKAIEQVKIHSVINLLLVRICTSSDSAHGARGGNNLMQTLSLSANTKPSNTTHIYKHSAFARAFIKAAVASSAHQHNAA